MAVALEPAGHERPRPRALATAGVTHPCAPGWPIVLRRWPDRPPALGHGHWPVIGDDSTDHICRDSWLVAGGKQMVLKVADTSDGPQTLEWTLELWDLERGSLLFAW